LAIPSKFSLCAAIPSELEQAAQTQLYSAELEVQLIQRNRRE
jgi:hypothetical protein